MLKVDTKEIFTVIRLPEGVFTVNVADNLAKYVTKQITQTVKNIIIDFSDVTSAEKQSLAELINLHQAVYENQASFVLCNVNDIVKKETDELGLSDVLNITPTESEAWDIVHMEEIERELLGDE